MEKTKRKYKYYDLRVPIPLESSKYNYMVTELQSMSSIERNSLVRNLLSQYYSGKLHREMESENNKESTKAAGDSDVSAKKKLDDAEQRLSKMLKKQKQLESQNQKLLGELEEQRQINKDSADKKEVDVSVAEDIASVPDTMAGEEENLIDADTLDEILSFMDTLSAT
jgi:hypothetical protein